MRIWDFTHYREYLEYRLGPEGTRTGLRKKLAAAIPVHTTFVSQVLKGLTDFSLEQAEAINLFLEHTDDEGEYFILLILKDRAGNAKLKMRFESKIKEARDARLNIKKRLESTNEISVKDREKFYSNAFYGVLHVLTAIPQFQTLEALSMATKLSLSRVREMIEFLISINVIIETDGKIQAGPKHVHLNNDSELILKHHINWRQFAITNLQFLDRDDVHYSAGMSLSVEDAFKIKESILSNLKNNLDLVAKSKDEVAYGLCIDFFKLS